MIIHWFFYLFISNFKGGTKRPRPTNVPPAPRKTPQPTKSRPQPQPQRPQPQQPQEDDSGSAGKFSII